MFSLMEHDAKFYPFENWMSTAPPLHLPLCDSYLKSTEHEFSTIVNHQTCIVYVQKQSLNAFYSQLPALAMLWRIFTHQWVAGLFVAFAICVLSQSYFNAIHRSRVDFIWAMIHLALYILLLPGSTESLRVLLNTSEYKFQETITAYDKRDDVELPIAKL